MTYASKSSQERDKDNLMRQLLSLSVALSLNFDEIFYAKAALNQKQQQQQRVQNTCQQFDVAQMDKEGGVENRVISLTILL